MPKYDLNETLGLYLDKKGATTRVSFRKTKPIVYLFLRSDCSTVFFSVQSGHKGSPPRFHLTSLERFLDVPVSCRWSE